MFKIQKYIVLWKQNSIETLSSEQKATLKSKVKDADGKIPPETVNTLTGIIQAKGEAVLTAQKSERELAQERERESSRERNRLIQFFNIKANLRKGKTKMDDIDASELFKIDKESGLRRGSFMAKSFLYKQTYDNDGKLFEQPTDGADFKEGETLFVDFGGNKEANRRIGLGHMLPSSIEYVKINGKIGMRSIIDNRAGYYISPEPQGYIPVFTGDIVTIPTQKEIKEFEEKIKNTPLRKITDKKLNDEANDAYGEMLKTQPIDTIEVNTNADESYNFWRQNGLSHEVACGILANEFQESNFNPKARGDSGNAHGIFQWHKPRRATILRGCGIDVSTASHADQLKAALWEMQYGDPPEGKVYNTIRNARTPAEAATFFSNKFERPRDLKEEAQKRGQMAEDYGKKYGEKLRS